MGFFLLLNIKVILKNVGNQTVVGLQWLVLDVLDVNLGLDDMSKVLLFVTYSIIQDIISSEM